MEHSITKEDVLNEGRSYSGRFALNLVKSFGDESGLLSENDPRYHERIEACIKCPHFGRVMPIPFVELYGCKICKCPGVTKARMTMLFRSEDKVGKSIDAKEIILARSGGKSFVREVVRCSDKSDDRWALTDQKYDNEKLIEDEL